MQPARQEPELELVSPILFPPVEYRANIDIL